MATNLMGPNVPNFSNSLFDGGYLSSALNLFRQGGAYTPHSSVNFQTGGVNVDPLARKELTNSYNLFRGRTNQTRNRLLSNRSPFVQARVDPYLRQYEAGRGELQRNLGLTGVRGTFRNRAVQDYDIAGQRELGDVRALAEQEVLNNVNALDAMRLEAGQNYATNLFNQEAEALGLGVDTVVELNRIAAGAYGVSMQGALSDDRLDEQQRINKYGMIAGGLGALNDIGAFSWLGGKLGFNGGATAPITGGDGVSGAFFKGAGVLGADSVTQANLYNSVMGTDFPAGSVAIPGSATSEALNAELASFGETGQVGPAMQASAAKPGFMESAGKFLKSPLGGGLTAGLLTGLLTGDWKKAAAVGVGAGIGNFILPGIGGVVGGFLGSLFGGNDKPHRTRHWIDFSPDTDNVASRNESGGTFEDFSYTGGQYNRNYGGDSQEAMRTLVETSGKQTELLLGIVGIPETEKDFLILPREGVVRIAARNYEGTGEHSWKYDPNTWDVLYTSSHSGQSGRTAAPVEKQWDESMSAMSFHVIKQSAIDAGGWSAEVANSYKGSDPAKLYELLHAASPTVKEAMLNQEQEPSGTGLNPYSQSFTPNFI